MLLPLDLSFARRFQPIEDLVENRPPVHVRQVVIGTIDGKQASVLPYLLLDEAAMLERHRAIFCPMDY
jgi:hypothetical protein